ncbi:hypothetical protein [Flavobacterium chilense]|uniref:CHAT domain-containing protein n=1 Tax=Flavobacterium chilense TaxID=946677 RepID=A0A1M7IRH6_9FLAO|nr:hypothetical protein [Flavobacterium chilense]SHM43404.1 hypothetical protein SAMN05444484_10622 [Flavobacterium chilense]
MDEKIVNDFHQKMTDERLNNHHAHEPELKRIYREIISAMSADYSEYTKHVPKFLSSLEANNPHSISYSLLHFFELYEQLLNTKQFSPFDLAIMDYEADKKTIAKVKPIFEASLSKNNKHRLSEENFDISTLTAVDKKEMSALIIHKLQNDSKQLNWTREMVDGTMMQLTFLRQILGSLHNIELLYHAVGLFIDRLTSSEYYQAGRDIAEEIIISSYKDGMPELGYFNSFRLYSNVGSIHAALLYANLSITSILNKPAPYSEKYIKEIIWQGIKFFRNVKLYPWAAKIYREIPVELIYTGHERRSLDHSYFTLLLMMLEPSLPPKLLDYMHKEREKIISGGINEALPWLLTLYNVRRLYPNADFGVTGFGFFLSIFELIVPSETIKKYKDIIEGVSEELKKHLKESLVKLNETRNTTDFVYDNEIAIRISNRLIEYSKKNQDAPAFLLSMMLKSDYSILFKQKESKKLAPLILPEINVDSLESLYENKDSFLQAFPVNISKSMNWLGFSEGKLYQLQLFNNEYKFSSLYDWNHDEYKELLNSNFFVDLSFDDTIKDKGGVRQISPEEFDEEEKNMAKKLSIGKIQVDEHAEEVYIVKDMELSSYPHNLLLNEKGDFIAKNIPITNVLSTEWLLQTNGFQPLPADFSKSIWIPIESGDYPLSYLFSNIEKTLQDNSFKVFKEVELTEPLSSDINIVCSHGAKDISETQIVFQENTATYDLNSVIGKGKILIFFVCYSGSMKTEFFRNNITSMVKRFIAQGYESVIAPYWALDVTIPRYWLPEFLESLDRGLTTSQAMFNANRKVYAQYPTPAAWGCLHLYGNPNLKIKES